jgi:hypothetical protein
MCGQRSTEGRFRLRCASSGQQRDAQALTHREEPVGWLVVAEAILGGDRARVGVDRAGEIATRLRDVTLQVGDGHRDHVTAPVQRTEHRVLRDTSPCARERVEFDGRRLWLTGPGERIAGRPAMEPCRQQTRRRWRGVRQDRRPVTEACRHQQLHRRERPEHRHAVGHRIGQHDGAWAARIGVRLFAHVLRRGRINGVALAQRRHEPLLHNAACRCTAHRARDVPRRPGDAICRCRIVAVATECECHAPIGIGESVSSAAARSNEWKASSWLKP